MATVLVTGSNGFIGKHLCRRLHADGFTVIGYDKEVDAESQHAEYETHLGEIGASDWVVSTHKPDFVFHLAAISHLAKCDNDPEEAINTNVIGIANLLLALGDCADESYQPTIVVAGCGEEYLPATIA